MLVVLFFSEATDYHKEKLPKNVDKKMKNAVKKKGFTVNKILINRYLNKMMMKMAYKKKH